ncbi:MAG: BsuBI/PstI family type II restriction endonuclease [Candidatus Micrarchaeia archaeon]
MRKVDDALEILRELNVPRKQQNERTALTLLALLSLKNNKPWKSAKKTLIRIHDIMIFIKNEYKKKYAENTRETIRRQSLHQLEKEVGIVERNSDDPTRPTNSPNTKWAVTKEALETIRSYGTKQWKKNVDNLMQKRGRSESSGWQRAKPAQGVIIDEKEYPLSPGKHNKLQIDIIGNFREIFCKDAEVLYFGDTAKKMLFLNEKKLKEIGLKITKHEILPDIVLLDNAKNRLYLIEAVTSHGPVSKKRQIELTEYFAKVGFKKIFVSAFPDFKEFKRHIDDIAWETEVWIAEMPEHMIHFNGDKFLKID